MLVLNPTFGKALQPRDIIYARVYLIYHIDQLIRNVKFLILYKRNHLHIGGYLLVFIIEAFCKKYERTQILVRKELLFNILVIDWMFKYVLEYDLFVIRHIHPNRFLEFLLYSRQTR